MNDDIKRILDQNDEILKLRDIIERQDALIKEYQKVLEGIIGKPKEEIKA